MGAMKNELHNLEERGHALIAQLEEKEHELAAPIRAWFNDFMSHLPRAEAKAKADAKQVEHDAVAVEAPVVTEAVQDVAAVGETAVAGDVTPPTPAAASTEPAK